MPHPSIAYICAHRLGDALSQTPSIRHLKAAFPDTSISIIAPTSAAHAVFKGNPDIDALYDASSKIPDILKGQEFDITVIGCRKKSAMPICKCINGPQLFSSGFGEITQRIDRHTEVFSQHTCVQQLEALSKFFRISNTCSDYSYTLPYSTEDTLKVTQTLSELQLSDKTLVGLHLGSRSASKHFQKFSRELTHRTAWRIKASTHFCNRLHQEHPNIRCLATGTGSEKTFTRRLAKNCPNVIDVANLFSIKQSAALMHHLRAFVTTDTGTLHIASSTPVHIIGLFAPSDPLGTGPFPGKIEQTILKEKSMDDINGEVVFEAVDKILKNT
jgi:ADP-heptose:LPS heptosyltransferase